MKTRDRLSLLVSLLLVGSILFLVSGAVAWFLRGGGESAGGASAIGGESTAQHSSRASGAHVTEGAPSKDVTRSTGDVAAERVAEDVDWSGGAPGDASFARQVEGRVVDDRGAPIAGATVRLELRPDVVPAERSKAQAHSVQTGSDGRFAFVGREPRDVAITLLVIAAGHAPRIVQESFAPLEPALDLGDLELLYGGSLLGQVVDARGAGLPGAIAELQPTSQNPLSSWSDPAAALPPISADATGCFEFTNLTPGSYRVVARAPGMQEGRVREAVLVEHGRDVEVAPIRLVPGFVIRGVVLGPDDVAVADAEVRIDVTTPGSRGSRARHSATTKSDGRFEADHLPSGDLRIEARAKGFSKSPRVEVAVDAAAAEEVALRLRSGLEVTGQVVDASTGSAIERFASRIRSMTAGDRGEASAMSDVLGRRIESLRIEGASDALVGELEARRSALAGAGPKSLARPARVPSDLGPIEDHPGGRFEFTGLDEGGYIVEIAPPHHRFASSGPIELSVDAKSPELRIEASPALTVSGVVVSRSDKTPIANATIELVLVDGSDPESGAAARKSAPSPFAWAFAPPGPRGDVIASTRSDERGRFELRHAPSARCFLHATHARARDARTEPFDLRADREDVRIELGQAASVAGKVRGVPLGLESEVTVFAVGGFGTLRTARIGPDGDYRIEPLQPGDYVLRAFFGPNDALERQVAGLFEPGREPPRPDVTLAEGESKQCDVTLALPELGTIEGSVTMNGQPAPGFHVVVRTENNDGSGAGGGAGGLGPRSLRSFPDRVGRFVLRNVPAGPCTLQVVGTTSRQEVHRESLFVAANGSTWVQAILSLGRLRGRIRSDDGTRASGLDGSLSILPGATKAPDDLRAYGREHRVHTVRVRNGAFEADDLTAGPALVIIELRGREPGEAVIEVPFLGTLEAELPAGRAR